MTQQDFVKLASYIKTAYPNSNFLPTQESINTYYEELKDLDTQTCMLAIREYIRNNDFPPTIAGIRKGCMQQAKVFIMPWNEAWESVIKAVNKYGQYGAIEAMNSLDEITRKCVKSIGFYDICTSQYTNQLKREFKEIYEDYKKEQDSKVQASNNPTQTKYNGIGWNNEGQGGLIERS